MRNAFLGKLRLNQGKLIFRLKVIEKTTAGEHIISFWERALDDLDLALLQPSYLLL